ncbi:SMP-30/gluconolactonase/LRE family protein [Nocardia gipuzkoensis]|uniref:SMP-30/gluconolactonase/LRE family protein n=1 Tax=Nocardia gipuzkoensis TaxID=2749991 RepID=UPI003EE2A583
MSQLSRRSVLAGSLLAAVGAATAACGKSSTESATTSAAPATQKFDLPAEFIPEGIAYGPGNKLYAGAYNGQICRVDIDTGTAEVITQGWGYESTGMKVDDAGRLFVCGGTGGDARVLDTRTSQVLAHYTFAEPKATLINDVVLARDAVWFTDSRQALLHRVPLSGSSLPGQEAVTTLTITGDFVADGVQSANGLCMSPDGRSVLVAKTGAKQLYRVDTTTGNSVVVDLGGLRVPSVDGLLLEGSTLYVALAQQNRVAVYQVAQDGSSASNVRTIRDGSFDGPTTIAADKNRLYLANSRTYPDALENPKAGTSSWISAVPKS